MIMTAAVTGTAVTVGILTGEAAIMTAMTMIMMIDVYGPSPPVYIDTGGI